MASDGASNSTSAKYGTLHYLVPVLDFAIFFLCIVSVGVSIGSFGLLEGYSEDRYDYYGGPFYAGQVGAGALIGIFLFITISITLFVSASNFFLFHFNKPIGRKWTLHPLYMTISGLVLGVAFIVQIVMMAVFANMIDSYHPTNAKPLVIAILWAYLSCLQFVYASIGIITICLQRRPSTLETDQQRDCECSTHDYKLGATNSGPMEHGEVQRPSRYGSRSFRSGHPVDPDSSRFSDMTLSDVNEEYDQKDTKLNFTTTAVERDQDMKIMSETAEKF